MEAGDAYVVETGDAGVEGFGGDGGFFGDREIAGASADYGNVALYVGGGGLMERDGSRGWVVMGGGVGLEYGFGGGGVGSGGENIYSAGDERGKDAGGLLGGFAGGVDDFREAGAERSVMVDAAVAEIFEGERGETGGGSLGGEGAALYGGEKIKDAGAGHLVLG